MTAASAPAHLVINAVYDSSITSLQLTNPGVAFEYTTAIATAIQYYESAITNPITVTITFGWGEAGGEPLSPGAVGESSAYLFSTNYTTLYRAVQATETTSPVQLAAAASLSPTDPTGGATFSIATAEADALGLIPANQLNRYSIGGSVGLDATTNFSWTQSNVTGVSTDAVGVLEHEISEVLGRTDDLGGDAADSMPDTYTLLDMFHYTAANNTPNDAPGTPVGKLDEPFVFGYNSNAYSYFSYDGKTVTLPYDTPDQVAAGDDAGDWTNSVLDDSYGFATEGHAAAISTTDLEEMNVLGYDLPALTIISPYQAILRTTPTSAYDTQIAGQITAGQTTIAQVESSLIAGTQAQQTTLPALIVYDVFYGATESSGGLDFVTNSDAAPLVSFFTKSNNPNVEEAIYSTLGSWFSLGGNNFATLYGSVDRTSYIDDIYQNIFGTLPASSALTYLLGSLNGYVNGIAAAGIANAEILGRGSVYGDLLFDAETSQSGKYYAPANGFLQAAASGTAAYGTELTTEFPATSTSAQLASDPGTITVTNSDQLINPGSGGFTIQFMAGTSADTLVLHAGGEDQVYGFDASTDVLDLRSVLAAANTGIQDAAAFLDGTIGITAQGSDAVIRFDPNGLGPNGATIAVIHGIAAGTTELTALIGQNAAPVQLSVVNAVS